LVKGSDYTIDNIVGAKEIVQWGGKVETIEFVNGKSTSLIIEKMGKNETNWWKRHNVFQNDITEGSKEYKEYYQKYPERKKIDDYLRSNPEVFSNPKEKKYNKLKSPLINAGFQYLADIKHLAEGECASEKVKTSPKEITEQLKIFSKFLGADLSGIAKLNANHYYSHRGREGNYGEKINNKHKYAIVFLTEMEEKMIDQAPNIENFPWKNYDMD